MFLEFNHLLQLCHQPHLHPHPLIHIISWPLYCFLIGPPAHDSQNDLSKQLSHTLRFLPYDSLQGPVHYSSIPISSLFTFYLCFTLSFPISPIGFPPAPDHGIQRLYLRAFPHTIFFSSNIFHLYLAMTTFLTSFNFLLKYVLQQKEFPWPQF